MLATIPNDGGEGTAPDGIVDANTLKEPIVPGNQPKPGQSDVIIFSDSGTTNSSLT
jgi:hypothetical protein